ncbi:MAG: hypothetical protein K2N15_09315, partial [Lachnospiraceae bacterium]|nr:hypothetical protein [Lachnospiraceae bacterium]
PKHSLPLPLPLPAHSTPTRPNDLAVLLQYKSLLKKGTLILYNIECNKKEIVRFTENGHYIEIKRRT